ncbi:MAG: SDR family NAD(P)-dependent oxidoreductase [Saccharolobus sp.]
MKVLVTGGAGFIGSHVCDILLERGYYVICVDNLSSGNMENIKHNLENPKFIFKKIDITDREMFFNAIDSIDVIIHLAAFKIPRYSSAYKTLLINTQGTKNVLDLAVLKGAKVMLGSTSDVYGKNLNLPFREDHDSVLGPSTSRRWAYAVSKLFDEHLAFAYQDEFNLEVVILRYFGTYGERQYLNWWGGPQGVFLEAIFKDQPVEIHGDGSQTRCFIYVKDAAEATVRAIEREEAIGEIINVGTEEEISILDLAKLMHRFSGINGELKVKYVPYDSFSKNYEDVKRRVPCIEKMENILGYQPKVSLEEGLKKLIKWYKDNKLLNQ